jgi:hypothetical protein
MQGKKAKAAPPPAKVPAAKGAKRATKVRKAKEYQVPEGPTLKYSVLVQRAEGLSETELSDYFSSWGTVVSVLKPKDDHGFVTFASAASVVTLRALPTLHSVGEKGKKVLVLQRYEPADPYWAKMEQRTEAALEQLENNALVTPKTLRFHESKRPSILKPGQPVHLLHAWHTALHLSFVDECYPLHVQLVWTLELRNTSAQDRMLESAVLVPTVPDLRLKRGFVRRTLAEPSFSSLPSPLTRLQRATFSNGKERGGSSWAFNLGSPTDMVSFVMRCL